MRLSPRKSQFIAHSEPKNTVQIRKWDFVWRTLVFIVLELAFLALATSCLTKPISLFPSSASSRTVVTAKAIITGIAVTWHTAALFPIKGIISIVFSAECIAQYRRTGHLQPNVTDRVSSITNGLLAQISHFLTLGPTLEYRLAFLLVLSTMALVPLGPSIIDLSPTWVTRYEDLPIANLTMMARGQGFMSVLQRQSSAKADEILSLEVVEGGTYGYTTQTNMTLIPWPKPGFNTSQKIIKYESDVVVYDYTCRWSKFMLGLDTSYAVFMEMPNVTWRGWDGIEIIGADELIGLNVITPLVPTLQDNPLPFSGFEFGRFNGSDTDSWVELGTGTGWIHIVYEDMKANANMTMYFYPGLPPTFLLCDPHYAIQRSEITLQDGQLSAIPVNDRPLLGNFPESAANTLFSQAFLNAFAPDETDANRHAVMSTFAMGPDDAQTSLTLSQINQNMSKAIQSAAKAYITGYAGFGESPLGVFPSYTSFNQTATIQYQEISLVSSRPSIVALLALDIVIILTLAILLCAANTQEMRLFNLQTMGTVYRGLPISDDDSSLPQQQHPDCHVDKLGFTWRMIAFVVPEFSFLAFAGYCFTKPIPVYLPPTISLTQARSATTAIVVAWRTLAVFPIKDIISFVFSAECIAQYRRTGRLEPNKTDRVSQATSGLVDQISHALSSQPTSEYWFALLLVLLVSYIGPLGPGVVTLTESPMTCLQDLLVANMSMDGGIFIDTTQEQMTRRAKTFAELELLEEGVYGYETATEGVLIPWPEAGFEHSSNMTTYVSDVVTYNYSCRWPTVNVHQPPPPISIAIPGVLSDDPEWVIWIDRPGDRGMIEGVDGILPMVVDITKRAPSQWPLSVVLFSGNSTLMDLENTGTSIHLDPHLPTALSFLLCDPQYKIQRANVTLSNGKLSAHLLPGLPLLGNFREAAANALFSQALLYALTPEEGRPFSPISMLLFTGELNGTEPLRPLPLSVINDNMNRAVKSAAKAYLSGYNSTIRSALSYTLVNQTATVQYQQIALVASRPFFIVLSASVAVTVIVMMVLLKIIDIRKMRLFNLQTLEKIYGDEMYTEDD